MKKWTVLQSNPECVKKILSSCDLMPLTAHVMSARGYNDIESLREFFDIGELCDNSRLKDMQKAVDAINQAVENGELIYVYGDYDCDGVTASSILYDYLRNIGADVRCYIPERAEGYGLNASAIDRIYREGASLIVTVDNGISAVSEAEYIYSLGMKLVITDHHQPSETLPRAEAVVDPHRSDCPSSFKELAGVGVALKLLAALDDGNYDIVTEQYADIAAIGTIADVVPLVSENRIIVTRGLELLRNTENAGLISLITESGLSPENIDSGSVAFAVAPRINASGRFGSAMTAFNMLTGEDESVTECARELIRLNTMRKETEAQIEQEIAGIIGNDPKIAEKRVIVLSGRGWHHGVIGIVAARMVEMYEKPVIVISEDSDGFARGSARSVKGFNIFKCFEYCKELLVKFGGHEGAGGLTIKASDIPAFDDMVQCYAMEAHPQMPRYTITIDKLVSGSDLSFENIYDLKRLQPYGAGNAEPVFGFSGALVNAVVPLKNGEHTRLDIEYDGVGLQAFLFRHKTASLDIRQGDRIDLAGTLSVNSFKGTKRISLTVCDYRLHGIRQDKYLAAYEAYEMFRRGERLDKAVLIKALPSREEMIAVYKAVRELKAAANSETLYARLGLNAFKLNVILDSFRDTGLISIAGHRRSIRLIKPDGKVDIAASETMTKLKQLTKD